MKVKRWQGPVTAGYSFWCAGCEERHMVTTEAQGDRPCWSFNGDLEKPVFGPSVLCTTIRHKTMTKSEWGEYDALVETRGTEAAMADPRFRHVCHSFVGCNGARPGEIVYLSDCTHSLAGKVISLPDLPSREGE